MPVSGPDGELATDEFEDEARCLGNLAKFGCPLKKGRWICAYG